MDEIGFLPYMQSLSKWPSFLERMCAWKRVVAEDSYSLLTFESLYNLHLRTSRLLKTRLIQYLSLDGVFSHLEGPAENKKKVVLGEAASTQSTQ